MFQSLLAGFKGLFAPGGSTTSAADNGFQERRRRVRLRCNYEVKATVGDKKFKATVVDIGIQGLKIRTSQKLKAGDTVVLAPPGPISGSPAQPVEGKVLWTMTPRKTYLTYAGISFSSGKEVMARSWVRLFLVELGFTQKMIQTQRRFIRADCFLEARFHSPQLGKEAIGRVYNLGVGGMLLESPYDLPIQEPVSLEFLSFEKLPPLKMLGYPVQAKREGTMKLVGIEFRDLSAEQLDLLSRYLKKLLKASWS